MIKVEEDYKVLHLEQRSFVISNLPVYTYNMKGDVIADYPYVQDDCYYSGYVEGTPDSSVVLSTCAGLWGHVQIGTLRYEIEPIENSPKFQHLIYRKTPEQREPCRSVVEEGATWTDEGGELQMVALDDLMPPIRGFGLAQRERPIPVQTFSTEWSLFYLFSQFVAQKGNETRLILFILLMMSNIHVIYLPLDLHIYLVGLELWTERDYITVSTNSLGVTLQAFYKYVRDDLRHRAHFDHAGILTAEGHPSGLAWGDSLCHYTHVSVSAVRAYLNPRSDAEVVAHQLGHSLGFMHDDTPANLARGCDCHCVRRGHCLMVETGTAECARLSNCSAKVYYDMIRQPGKECLLNVPAKIFQRKVCGNGIVEGDEECDCGQDEGREGEGILNLFLLPDTRHSRTGQPFKEQDKREFSSLLRNDKPPTLKGPSECRRNGCCQENCKSKPGIDCLHGPCCEKCKFLEEGKVCRQAATECDLPEYCNGTSAECPPDLYKQDGMPCGEDSSCFLGNCLDLQRHCIALFGQDAQPAPLSCFKERNMRGDPFGNCGRNGEKYRKCHERDILCGRLQCTHIKQIPHISTAQGILQTPVEETLCWGTKFHPRQEGNDPGVVKDGTACGVDKICINRSCVDLAVLKHECNFSQCHHRGVCNSNGNCHCSYGWAPPFCTGRGYGGSIDSGPPAAERMATSRIVGLVILTGLALFGLGFVASLKRQQLETWYTDAILKRLAPESEHHQESRSADGISLKSQTAKLDLTVPE
uniref:Disintegrin and metalloproteinase domain-containing protein 9-like n=1 Tax=Pogona vitticeps TaxID=103695 RepID=A0ABM5FV73_9SAUR